MCIVLCRFDLVEGFVMVVMVTVFMGGLNRQARMGGEWHHCYNERHNGQNIDPFGKGHV